jgi:spore coat polysaccharide biosynthesis protein SpsF
MRVGAVIQARVSSVRLPGKVVRPLRGKPMIAWLVERLRAVRDLDGIVLATSQESDDDALAALAAELDLPCFRGALGDVGGRMLAAGLTQRFDAIVRVNGDSPLLDPALVAEGIALFRATGAAIVSNVRPRSYPKGQSVEVIATVALAEAMGSTKEPADREHVTPFLYAHPERFPLSAFGASRPRPELQLSIDTAEDWARIEAILDRMTSPHLDYGVEALIALADRVEAERQVA